jgi:hypothetical protein
VKKLTVLSALALALLSSSGYAVRPHNVSEEADDTAKQRDEYFLLRRAAPYGVTFDAAQARLKAYQQFQAAITAEKTNPGALGAHSAQLHTEVWQNIGPGPILGGQTPTDASSTSRSPVSGRVSAVAIDAIDGAV